MKSAISNHSKLRIDLQDISVIYTAKGAEMTAIQDINLTIFDKEFISIVGPSGCGKSTLLRVIAKLLAPTKGVIQSNNHSPSSCLSTEGGIGYICQEAALLDWRTVLENIALPMELSGFSQKEAQKKALPFVERVGLQGFINSYPHELSGGMRQRVAIARALSTQPELLLMDEPFSALDELNREKMNMELLSIWSKTQSTVIFVTHFLPEAVYLADRVLVFSQSPGYIAADIAIPLNRPRTLAVRNSKNFQNLVQYIRSLMRRNEKIENEA